MQLLVDHPDRLLDGGLRVDEAINDAKSSPATFYRKFGGKAAFLNRVLERLVTIAYRLPDDVTTAAQAAVDEHDGDRRRAVRALIESSFGTLFDGRTAAARLLAATLGAAAPRTALALRDGYRRSDTMVVQLFDTLFARSGATLRKPFTANGLSVAVTALVEGFALRRGVDRNAVTPELVADTILAVVGAAVDPAQRHQHVDDALTALADPPRTRMPREPRNALLATARLEFGKRGYFGASLEQIAAQAGVRIDATRRFFPTKLHLIVAALNTEYAALRQGIADDLLVDLDEVSIVENHLLRCAQLVARERPFMDALMAAVAHDTYADPDGMLSVKTELNLPALIVPVIEQGQRNGVFVADEAPGEIAAFLINSLLLRCFTRRNHTAEQCAAFASRVMLDGVRS